MTRWLSRRNISLVLFSGLLVVLIILPACANKELSSSVTTPASSQIGKTTPVASPTTTSPQPATAVATAADVPVPAKYAAIYSNLKTALDQFDASLVAQGSSLNPVVFGAELITANCNRGEDLLKPGVLASVKLYLDRLQALGVQGVTIPIHYPLYTPQFPRYTEYVTFYKQVVQEVRSRGLKLDIESHVIFANTPFSPIKWDYSVLTFDQYKAARKSMIQQVVNDLHPDYLNVGAEPDTEATLLGMNDLLDPQKYTDYIAFLLDGFSRGSTRVVAGVGSWGNLEYARKMAVLPALDGLSLHVYPVIGGSLTKVMQLAQLAADNKKFVDFDECWLSKTDVLVGGVSASPEIFRRDAFSFWAPLDRHFLTDMVNFARLNDCAYISPFWTGFFFAYLDYSPEADVLSYADTSASLSGPQSDNIRSGQFSSTGEAYKALISQNR